MTQDNIVSNEWKIDEKVQEIIDHMEENKLTCVEFDFKTGWKFKLIHPKRQRILLSGGHPYDKIPIQNKEKDVE